MQLANDEFIIALDGVTITLRPSLRAAFRLANKYENFSNLAKQIADFNLQAVFDIYHDGADYRLGSAQLVKAVTKGGLIYSIARMQPVLMAFVITLAGANEPEPKQSAKPSKPVPFKDHFQSLFEIGTGALGWSPADTWQATPAEIQTAYKGRIDLLKMIFGNGDESKPATSKLSLDDKARMAFANIGIRKA